MPFQRATLLAMLSSLLSPPMLVASEPAASGVRVRPHRQAQHVVAYQRLEWRVELDQAYANPFDPDEIAVDATFSGPDGRALVVPAFWMTESGGSSFAVRFAPPAPGNWRIIVKAKDRERLRTSQAISFEVAPSKNRGFVRRAPNSAQYLQFDSGDPFFIVGLNLAWAGKQGLKAYEEWFARLSENGGNFARIWMAHPNLPTETAELGVGRYDQEACAFYDAVFDAAERRGVYCMVTLNNHRDLLERDMWGPARWPHFPYNAAVGGPAKRPGDFISDARCQKLFRQRLRYVVARYAAYASVAFWELWNEQHYANVEIPPSWTRQMARYLKEVDPHKHLVTTSFGSAWQDEVWEMPEIDLTQDHLYAVGDNTDAAETIAMSSYRHARYGKPHLVGEFGINGEKADAEHDRAGVGTNMHNGVWAGMMSGGAGGGSIWWWDNYVAPRDLWKTFRGASVFARAIDWPRRTFVPIFPQPPVLISAANEPETFGDAVLRGSSNWGKSHGQLVELLPNGQAYRTIPRYLYGPEKKELVTPTKLAVTVPQGGKVVVRVAQVSDSATLRVFVDGQPKRDFFFSALPGSAGQQSSELTEHKGYRAVFNEDCELDLEPGPHTIELRVIGGDWLTIDSITVKGAKSSRYSDLRVLALHDESSGELIAWLQDPASNWRNDADGVQPRTITSARLSLPVKRDGSHRIEWWNTRTGEIMHRDQMNAVANVLMLDVPPVVRDVALRIRPH
jgi:hypothetical protein